MKRIRKQNRIHFCDIDFVVKRFVRKVRFYSYRLVTGLLEGLGTFRFISLSHFIVLFLTRKLGYKNG